MTPPQYTYDAISPLVTERSKRGRRIAVRFACPVSELTATASYAVPATRNDNIARVAGRGLLFGLQAAIGLWGNDWRRYFLARRDVLERGAISARRLRDAEQRYIMGAV